MVEAIAKLVEAIRDPRPGARGKTVWPGRAARRAERAADDAGEKMPEARAPHHILLGNYIVMADDAAGRSKGVLPLASIFAENLPTTLRTRFVDVSAKNHV